ncbi:MAG: DNA (cytosine-5-)-methyltransferase [Candidatus Cloacimonetes bacterium]|nr:DNA (cytosine-5-)-methyltransferase [Candidatus Cloacimonadota bacterium]
MLKVVEAFSGIGSQRQALKNINAEFEIVATMEWDINAVYAYDIIHHGQQDKAATNRCKKDIIEELMALGVSSDGKKLASAHSLNYYSLKALDSILFAFKRNNNLGSITNVSSDLLPNNIDILTYSFPCQNLSACGAWHKYMTGIDKIHKNQSNMIWEIKRILNEFKETNKKLPKFLLMENVKNITYKINKVNFDEWQNYLTELGYVNSIWTLDALRFGIPQHRKRTFMISVLCENGLQREILNHHLKGLSMETDLPLNLMDFLRTDYSNQIYRNEAEASNPNNTKSRQKIYEENDKLLDGCTYTKTITTKQDRHPNSGVINYKGKKLGKASFRFLTPRECFLLMGFDEKDYDFLLKNNIEAKKGQKLLTIEKLHKLIGNSIVVNVLEAIFKQIIRINNDFFTGF